MYGGGLGQWEAIIPAVISAGGTAFTGYLGWEKMEAEQKAAKQAYQLQLQQLAMQQEALRAATSVATPGGPIVMDALLGGISWPLIIGGAAVVGLVVYLATRK